MELSAKAFCVWKERIGLALQTRDPKRTTPKPGTSARIDLNQWPLLEQDQGSDFHKGTISEESTSVGPGTIHRTLRKQAKARDSLRTRHKSGNSARAAQTRNICRNRTEAEASDGEGMSLETSIRSNSRGSRLVLETPANLGMNQGPLLEQAQASDLCLTRSKAVTSAGIAPSKKPSWKQSWTTSGIAEQPRVSSNLHEHWVTLG